MKFGVRSNSFDKCYGVDILMKHLYPLFLVIIMGTNCTSDSHTETRQPFSGASGEVRLITLDPGHFHAGLVQKFMYEQVDPVVHVYAPEGPDVTDHLSRINGFNTREENPTQWEEKVYAGDDFLDKMLAERAGNVLVISGNNAKKTQYILAGVEAGINVLADKPMVIKPEDFDALKTAFEKADENGVLLQDIMTERYEITTILQKELSQVPEVFGVLKEGSPEEPAITKESVHHLFKYVAGKPLKRPAWFLDVEQQGEGVVDISTHLVDLVFWECFPEQSIHYQNDIEMISARRWPTELYPAQFTRITHLPEYPSYLEKDIVDDSVLQVYCNGEIVFKVKGIHAKVSVIWEFEAPEGGGDTHYSIMRGSLSNLVIRQGAEQQYRPVLYVEPVDDEQRETVGKQLEKALEALATTYPGLEMRPTEKAWEIVIPEKYKVGHEAHFAQVTDKYLQYLIDGQLPDWEIPNILAKYYVTTSGYRLSR